MAVKVEDEKPAQGLSPRNGVLALNGLGLRIAVERGHLFVSDGIGSPSFGNELRFREEETNALTGPFVPIDFVKNAASLGAGAIAAGTAEEFQAALEEARGASRITLIYVPVDAEARVPNYEGWWEVPIAEVSEEESVQRARAQYEEDLKKQRIFVS